MNIITKTFEELTTREIYEIIRARQNVFIIEQECIYPDNDGMDPESIHIFLKNEEDESILAYLRLLWKEESESKKMIQIGRVLTSIRGLGYGRAVLREGIKVAFDRMHADSIYLEAQEYAIGFYAREGFEVCSEVFLEDGIPHVKMMLYSS